MIATNHKKHNSIQFFFFFFTITASSYNMCPCQKCDGHKSHTKAEF